MKKLSALLPALLAATSLFAQAPLKPTLDKAALESYLRHMEMWIPVVEVAIDDPKPSKYLPGFNEVVVHLSYNGQGKEERYYVSSNGKNVIKGTAYAMDLNPFQENLDKLKLENQPFYGTPGAPVQLAIFGDFQCPYCKAEAEELRANLVQTFGEKVQVIFKDFPLESIHPWARAASITGRCIYNQDKAAFWNYHDWIYKTQASIKPETLNSEVQKWAGENGVDPVQLGRCVESKATNDQVQANIDEGHSLGVDSTPTAFLNGRKLGGALQWEVMKQLVALEIEHAEKSTKN